ncbi:hypothetical protein F2Q70_00038278 [Brassica cretica]|uniref:Uncharacterized protein n=1 Tax=Brassica cretica TaxID=69181 RepID=A0A8S9K8Q8_BRACR|nr:hypothetical protein F2Q70_00038278 [Brassica cretica]
MDMSQGKSLADSIKAKLESLSSLSNQCCIYKVPNKLRRLNPDVYSPRLVSFGPFHRGKEDLQAMEEHKYRYLQSFLPRASFSLEDLVRVARTWEEDARSCYAEDVKLNSDEFVKMLVVDGSFLVELILRSRYPHLITENDRIFGKPWMITDVCRDMILIENQLPFFIVKGFFNLLTPYYQQGTPSILDMVKSHFRCFLSNIDDNMCDSEPEHFVDYLRSCYLPLAPIRLEEGISTVYNAPKATELHNAGVKFKPSETSSCLLDLKFADGVLEIPTIMVDDLTESLFRNIVVFEQCHFSEKSFFHYIRLLSCFIRSPADADLLIRSGIFLNSLGVAEDISDVFDSIFTEVIFGRKFYFQSLSENLPSYCNTPWNRWKAILRHDYFHNPWSVTSVLAALILLLLTFIQAVCSILALELNARFHLDKSVVSRSGDSVPKKKGRLVGLGRRTRSVPPSSAPPPFVDPEVLTAQLKDKDDRISLLETQMAAQQAGYEAQRRLNQQMMEMMQRMYPNEGLIPRNFPRAPFLGIFRGLRSSEFSEGSVPRKFPMKILRNISSELPRIGPSESPSKYPEEVLPQYIPRSFPTNWWSSEFPRKFVSSEFRQ